MTNTFAKVTVLPTAALEPIHQAPRRGRYPANVTKIRRGYLIKLDATLNEQRDKGVQFALGLAEGYYWQCKRIHDDALAELQAAQQRARKIGGAV